MDCLQHVVTCVNECQTSPQVPRISLIKCRPWIFATLNSSHTIRSSERSKHCPQIVATASSVVHEYMRILIIAAYPHWAITRPFHYLRLIFTADSRTERLQIAYCFSRKQYSVRGHSSMNTENMTYLEAWHSLVWKNCIYNNHSLYSSTYSTLYVQILATPQWGGWVYFEEFTL